MECHCPSSLLSFPFLPFPYKLSGMSSPFCVRNSKASSSPLLSDPFRPRHQSYGQIAACSIGFQCSWRARWRSAGTTDYVPDLIFLPPPCSTYRNDRSSIVLSRYMEWHAHHFAGTRCLDLSAGCGLAGRWLGRHTLPVRWCFCLQISSKSWVGQNRTEIKHSVTAYDVPFSLS